ncbi:MAG: DUF814 domain-containing protein [Desulfovibrio sp.]|nr:DUF814 domain-containing protein [Desulfovibrio sp.]
MDAHLFRRFCDATVPRLTGARVEKLQEPAPDTLVITVYGFGLKQHVCWHSGRKDAFCFLTDRRISSGHAPEARVMRLRKYVSGRRILSCVVQWCRRRLWLLLGGQESTASMLRPDGASPSLTWLLLDLREGASLHFLSESESPEEDDPLWPEPTALASAMEDWRHWPVLTPALRRCLVRLEPAEQAALLQDLRAGGGDIFCYGPVGDDNQMNVRAIAAWPLPTPLRNALSAGERPLVEWSGSDILPMLERAGQDMVLTRLAEEGARAAAEPLVRQRRKLEKLLDKLREEEKRLLSMKGAQADALALQENLWRWPADWRADRVSVTEGAHGPARDIRLDRRHTVREEMARLFHTARRGQRGLQYLAGRRAALEGELADLRTRLSNTGLVAVAGPSGETGPILAPVANLPGIQVFVSSDGFTLLRGRDAKGNLAVHRLAAGHDIWLHAENGPGAHVVIRRAHGGQTVPERTLDEAGSLAALKSWQKDAVRARIQYAEVRHVKPMRRAPAGTVRIDKALPSRDVMVDASVEERLLPRQAGA